MAGDMHGVEVLVTGATGFLGSHLTRRLVAEGARVRVLARAGSSFQRLGDVRASLEVLTADLSDAAGLARCVRQARPRVVFHLAGDTAGRSWVPGADAGALARSYEHNLGGTLRLLTALLDAPTCTRIVRAGGLEEYGTGALPYREDQREAPVSPYSASQVAATHLAQMLHRQVGLPVVTLRPALTYGPRQAESFFIPALIRACLAGQDFQMTAGDQTRDFVYVDDVVEAFLCAARARDVDGEVINAGTGREHTLAEVADLIVRLSGSSTRLQVGARPGRSRGLQRLVCDPSRARELLGWQARVPLEEGLARSIAWQREARGPAPSADR